jgi:hypothetical protein
VNVDSPAPYVSVGGLAIGLGILAWYLFPWWWKGRKSKNSGKSSGGGQESGSKRDWRELLPLASGLAIGSLAAACTGGLLGWAAHGVSRANESVGDVAVTGATGAEGTGVDQGALPTLNGGAAIVAFLALVAVVALWKKMPEAMRKELAAGGWAGVSLALSAGAAGVLARTVVPAVNSLGDSLTGVL